MNLLRLRFLLLFGRMFGGDQCQSLLLLVVLGRFNGC
jgi:hypothetical protein